MKTSYKIFVICAVLVCLFFSSCGSGQAPAPMDTPQPTAISTATSTLVPTATATHTATPVPTPTAKGGAVGVIVYTRDQDSVTLWPHYPSGDSISIIDSTGQEELLVSLTEITELIPGWNREDRISRQLNLYPDVLLSPDAKKLLIGVDVSHTSNEYYIANTDLSFITKLEQTPFVATIFWTWSPDSAKLVGSAQTRRGVPAGTYIVNSDGSDLEQIAGLDIQGNVFWSPDSSMIYLSSWSKGIWAINLDGLDKNKVEINGLEPNAVIECIQPSVDSNKIVFMAASSPVDNFHQVFISNSNFSNPTLITEFTSELVVCSKFEWSPDKSYLLVTFDNICTAGSCSTGYGAYLFHTDAGALIDLPLPDKALVCGWAPDNSLVYLQGEPDVDDSQFFNYKDSLKLIDISKETPKAVSMKLSSCPLVWLSE